MKQLDKLNFSNDTLVAFYLGGKIEGINIEAHDVCFYIGKRRDEFLSKIKEKWIGIPNSLHVDSFLPLTHLDGYTIKVKDEKDDSSDLKLFFINLGYYNDQLFGEHHYLKFVIAKNKSDAKKKAKEDIDSNLGTVHTDNLYDIDECIQIDEVDSKFITIKTSSNETQESILPENGWMRLS